MLLRSNRGCLALSFQSSSLAKSGELMHGAEQKQIQETHFGGGGFRNARCLACKFL
jgi:hypothetical protein